jgi:HTH-type transcriptional regulator/antitoxin HigA
MTRGDGKVIATAKRINTKKYGELLQATMPRVIRSDKELDAALAVVNNLMSKKRTAEEDELFLLVSSLVEAYEDKHHSIEPLPPVELLKELMADRGLKQKDIAHIFGSQGVTSEVLNGKREINKNHAKKLAEYFDLPVGLFI